MNEPAIAIPPKERLTGLLLFRPSTPLRTKNKDRRLRRNHSSSIEPQTDLAPLSPETSTPPVLRNSTSYSATSHNPQNREEQIEHRVKGPYLPS